MSTVIRHGGAIAKGVTVAFSFDPATGRIECEHSGQAHRSQHGQLLRRYRALRHEFLERVAASIGGSVAVCELDEHGRPGGLRVVDAPRAGHA